MKRPTAPQLRVHDLVVKHNHSISEVGITKGISESTVRRYMDIVTDWNIRGRKELEILTARIDRAVGELEDLNGLITAASGNSSVSRKEFDKMATNLKDNAFDAIYDPSGFVPTSLLRGDSNG